MAKKKRHLPSRKRRLQKSKNKIVTGVIGGLAEYFNVDPTLLRISWLLIFSLTGFIPGIIAYVGASIVMPK